MPGQEVAGRGEGPPPPAPQTLPRAGKVIDALDIPETQDPYITQVPVQNENVGPLLKKQRTCLQRG